MRKFYHLNDEFATEFSITKVSLADCDHEYLVKIFEYCLLLSSVVFSESSRVSLVEKSSLLAKLKYFK